MSQNRKPANLSPSASITRRVMPLVVGAFVVMGLIGAFITRNNTYATVRERHDIVVNNLSYTVREEISRALQDINAMRVEQTLRQFALLSNTEISLVMQNDMLAVLLSFIEQHSDAYAAIRYIDDDTRLRAEVINYLQVPVVTNPQLNITFEDDPAFRQALEISNQQAYITGPFIPPPAVNRPQTEQRPVIRFGMPVRFRESSQAPLGVLQVDVYAEKILGSITGARQSAIYYLPERYFLLVNSQNQIILDTRSTLLELFESNSAGLQGPGTEQDNAARLGSAEEVLLTSRNDILLAENDGLVISIENVQSPIQGTNLPWRLVLVDSANQLFGEANNAAFGLVGISVLAGLVAAGIISQMLHNTIMPLERARAFATRITQEKVDFTVLNTRSEEDEFLQALNVMSDQLGDLSKTMENQRRRLTRNLEIAARVSRESAMLNDLDELLNRVINLICTEYSFYHSQIFLLDDVGLNAVLAYSYGDAGRQLLERRHKLAVGSRSVIGAVTAQGKAVIVNDTVRQQDQHAFNPLLAYTRSEMALPLQIGNEVIGALDIQSVNPNAFNNDDVQVFQLLADQLALAIYNGRLLMQSRERINQIDSLNRQLTREAWDKANDNLGLERSYTYDLQEISDSEPESNGHQPVTSVPLRIRGQVVGALDINLSEGDEFSENDVAIVNAITDRVSLALENARLFQETQTTLNETSILYDLSSRINEADSLEAVIHVIVETVMPDATGGQILEFADHAYAANADWLTITADWAQRPRAWQEATLVGLRLHRPDLTFLASMDENTVLVVGDMEQDERIDDALRVVLGSTGARALAVIPLNMRGLWRALLMIEFPAPRRFTPRDTRLYTALIDQAGTAVDNRLLLQQTEETLELRERMYAAGRAVNAAETPQDLVAALLATTSDRELNFMLSQLEGPLNADGWPENEHLVARTQDYQAVSVNEIYPLVIAPESPLYQREPEIIVDTNPDEPFTSDAIARMRDQGQGFRAIFPLFSENHPIALFYVTYHTAYEMPNEDYEFYVALTGQMSTVLQKRHLLEQTEQALEEARLLYAASRSINAALDLTAVYDVAVDYIVSASSQVNRVAVLLTSPEADPKAPDAVYTYAWTRGGRDKRSGKRVSTASTPYIRLAAQDTVVYNRVDQQLANDPQYNLLREVNTTSIAIAPLQFRRQWFGVLVCESTEAEVFDGRLSRFIQAVADQIAISLENRRLFLSAESERELLSSILETMPSGVLVLDPQTYIPIQVNAQVALLLGRSVDMTQPFTAEMYNIYRTGTQLLYNTEELPIYNAITRSLEGGPAFADDLVVIRNEDSHIDLLMNAAPIVDAQGNISSIVTVIEDISSLRGLESALQDNLRETVTLYEASRSLAAADEVRDVVETLIEQFYTIEATEVAILLRDEVSNAYVITRTLYGPASEFVLPQEIIAYEEPLFIEQLNDIRDTDLETELTAIGVVALAALPLQVRSRAHPMGWVILTFATPRAFADDERRFLTTLVESASTILDNRYLFQSTQAALQEASVLYNASRALTEASTHREILKVLVDHVIPDDITMVFMVLLTANTWDDPNAIADVVASWSTEEVGMDLTGLSLSPAHFPPWRLLTANRLLLLENIRTDGDLSELERAGIESLGLESLIAMPLRVANRVMGTIWMGSGAPRHFTDRDHRIYSSFAEQASITIEAARLLEQTERRARQLATSSDVSQVASSILDLDRLLNRLVELIREAFHYDHVQIFLMDREDQFAELRASTGEAGEQLLNIKHKLAKGSVSVIGTVTAEARPVIALDTGNTDVVHRPNPYLPHTRSEIGIPIIIKGKVVGALDVQSNEPNAFSEEDVAVLTTLAAQTAVAIDNARLFEQAEHRASDMSLLFAVTTAAASAEKLEEALQLVTEDLLDSMRARTVAIYLPVVYVDEVTDETHNYLRMTAISGVNQPISNFDELRIGDANNIVSIAASSFRSLIINRTADEPQYRPLATTAQSAIIVPLVSGARLIGMILMEDLNPFAYDHETLTLLQTMGGSLSAIIQNAQLLGKLQQTNDQLLELDRIKSEFLANMSHELRTPLNSIIGFSRVILKGIDGPLTEMQEQDLTTIYNSGQHLLGLINDILDQAKIAAGKMDLKPDYFDVKPVVEGVRSIGIGLVKDKPVNIKLEIESGLPKVYGDEFRTRQVLLNLISNASKFTMQGAITLSVYRYQEERTLREMVRIDVNDTGIGIDEKDMPLLFQAFRQVDSSLTRTAGGTGLGLPISKSLVELQGGEILVTSQVNVGSTFSITIPLEPVTDDRQHPRRKTDDLNSEAVPVTLESEVNLDDTLRLKTADVHKALADEKSPNRVTKTMPTVMPTKRQVLLIEDNPDRVDQYRRVLQREGFDIFTASIPLEAEAMASGLRPSIIIMDVNFAGGKGWDILAKIKDRDDTFDIPVIVVTLSNESERAFQLGAFDFLQHPIMPDQLTNSVTRAEKETNTERILIIDDQPESTRLLTQLLDTYGKYRVFSAHNGMEGVSLVARRRPDLVILDLRMPDMDGFAVLEELRSNPETANIPVLVVTGDSLSATEQSLLADATLLYKTDISLEDYERFIIDVEAQLLRNGE